MNKDNDSKLDKNLEAAQVGPANNDNEETEDKWAVYKFGLVAVLLPLCSLLFTWQMLDAAEYVTLKHYYSLYSDLVAADKQGEEIDCTKISSLSNIYFAMDNKLIFLPQSRPQKHLLNQAEPLFVGEYQFTQCQSEFNQAKSTYCQKYSDDVKQTAMCEALSRQQG